MSVARKYVRVAGASLAVLGLARTLGVGITSPMTDFLHVFVGAPAEGRAMGRTWGRGR